MTSFKFKILRETEKWVVIEKPSGFHVHRPERRDIHVPKEIICLNLLRKQLGHYVYPVHRLDVATSGALLFARDPDAASRLGVLFQEHQVVKTYLAVVRGYAPDHQQIELPLLSDSTGELAEASTEILTIGKSEMPFAIGKRFSTARFSLVLASPHTGRYHQIRRHLARLSHPIIGDREHGDSHQNRFFREQLGIPGLCLRSLGMAFRCPYLQDDIEIQAGLNERWEGILSRLEMREFWNQSAEKASSSYLRRKE